MIVHLKRPHLTLLAGIGAAALLLVYALNGTPPAPSQVQEESTARDGRQATPSPASAQATPPPPIRSVHPLISPGTPSVPPQMSAVPFGPPPPSPLTMPEPGYVPVSVLNCAAIFAADAATAADCKAKEKERLDRECAMATQRAEAAPPAERGWPLMQARSLCRAASHQ